MEQHKLQRNSEAINVQIKAIRESTEKRWGIVSLCILVRAISTVKQREDIFVD